jgi:hypothetical protein
MARKRQTDPKILTWFRSDRMMRDQGNWFFQTREHTIEGPFHNELQAQTQLDIYINMHKAGIIESASDYSLSRFDIQKTG